eukprot:UN17929
MKLQRSGKFLAAGHFEAKSEKLSKNEDDHAHIFKILKNILCTSYQC